MFKDVWEDNYGLGVTFWLWGTLGSFIFGLFLGFTLYFLNLYSTLGVALLALPWSIFIWVGIWRSSNKQPNPNIWGILAKVSVVFGIIYTFYTIFSGDHYTL